MLPADLLSPREVEIANAYARGDTYQTIARRLGIAPSTVRTHLSTVYRKLEVSSKLELHAQLEGAPSDAPMQIDHAAIISELALSLEEAIHREKAFSEVLRIISRSRGDTDAVMSAILDFALEICDAEFGILFDHQPPSQFEATYTRGIPADFQNWLDRQGLFVAAPQTGLGRVAAGHGTVNIFDVRAEELFKSDESLRYATAILGGARSFVAIPMMAGDQLVGAFSIYRQSVRPFSDQAVTLAQTFADQSVIALENARLFRDLQSQSARR